MDSQNNPVQGTDNEGLTRRRALGYTGAVVAGAAATSVVAAGAAEATPGSGSRPMRTVSLDQATRIINAAVRYVEARPALRPMFILVVDACGDEKASKRMDGNGAASVSLVPIKAHTARTFGQPTADLGAAAADDPLRIASFTTAGFSLLGGGRPIFDGEFLIGAIGVGGGSPEQDDQVARAALRAL